MNISKAWCVALAAIGAVSSLHAGLESELTRPQLHLTAPAGWINDPNGLSYYKGEWHCFAQHNPDGVAPCWQGKDVCWYHWVSSNLLHWTALGVAIHQDELGTCASGSAVTDVSNTAGFGAGAHVLVYSQLTGPVGQRHGKQCLAYSQDGRTYVKYAGNPVCETLSHGGDRDPKVFWYGRGETPHWVIVLYVEHDGSAYYTIYTSPDLKTWTFSQEIRAGASGTQRGWLYECPGMEELGIEGEDATRWIIWSADADYYQLGTFDGYTFTPDGEKQRGLHQPGNETLGSGFYAAQSFSGTPDGRCIWMAWFQNPPGNGTLSGAKWSQCLSIPQELSLRRVNDALRLVRHPVAEFAGLRAGEAVPLDRFSGDLAEVSLKCKLTASGSIAFNLRGMTVSYDAATQKLTAGGSSVNWPLREGGELALTVFLDRGCAEVFAQDGLDMLPVQTLPSSAANRSLSVASSVGVSETEFKAWPLSSIWGEGEQSDSKQKVAKPEVYIPSRFAGEYVQLAYLRSTVGGGQYVKSGIQLSESSRVKIHFALNGVDPTDNLWAAPFGSRKGGANQFTCVAGYGQAYGSEYDGWLRRFGSQTEDAAHTGNKGKPVALGEHTFDLNRNVHDFDGYVKTFNGETFAEPQEMYVFAANNVGSGGAVQFAPMDFYSMQVWQNDVLVRHYLPCQRASDGALGLLDIVEHPDEPNYNPFYANEGSGSFIAGPFAMSLTVDPIAEQAYDGLHPCCPAVTVRAGDTVLDPSSYVVRYIGNDAVGTDVATVMVTGKGDYDGSTGLASFSIAAAPQGRLTCTVISCPEWTGEPVTPTYSVKLDGTPVASGDYEAILRNNNAVGTGTLVVTGLTGKACAGLAAVTGFAIVRGKGLVGDYYPVEYIEDDGATGYYETDFFPNPQTDRIAADMRFLSINGAGAAPQCIWCARDTANTNPKAWMMGYNTAQYGLFTKYYNNSGNLPNLVANTRYLFSLRQNVFKVFNVDGSVFTSGALGSPEPTFDRTGGPVNLFANYGTPSDTRNAFSKCRMYAFRIYRNEKLIHCYLPVRNELDEAFLYDVCEEKSVLTKHGGFTAGPDCGRVVMQEVPAVAYDGEHAYTPAVSALDVATARPVGNLSDYFDIAYSDNTAPGFASVTLTGKAGTPYAGQIDTRYFRIVQAYRVAPGAAAGGEGTWDSPMTFAEAWSAAAANGGEVWLRKGTHALSSSSAEASLAGAVAVRGGFDGTEVTSDDRTSQDVSTIDGVGQYSGLAFSNAQSVEFEQVRFTRTKGFAVRKTSGSGALAFRKCRISSNLFGNTGFSNAGAAQTATGWGINNFGGVVQGYGATAAMFAAEDCVFDGNALDGSTFNVSGGAVGLVSFFRATFDNCLFASNSVPSGEGAGLCVGTYATSVRMNGCAFRGNYAVTKRASVVAFWENRPAELDHCLFAGNYCPGVDSAGSGIVRRWSSVLKDDVSSTFRNCTFAYNILAQSGVLSLGSNQKAITVDDSIFFGNVKVSANKGAGYATGTDISYESGAITVRRTLFGGEGTAYVDTWGDKPSGSATLTDCVFANPKFVTTTAEFKQLFAVDTIPLDQTTTFPGYDKAVALDCHVRPRSKAIDAGDPAADWSTEPRPNGERANIGVYGGTPEAAKSAGGLLLTVR